VVKEGEAPPPEITVRVCATLSCALAGAGALRGLARTCGATFRSWAPPSVCEHAPRQSSGAKSIARRRKGCQGDRGGSARRNCAYRGYAAIATAAAIAHRRLRAQNAVSTVMTTLEESGLRGLGAPGFSQVTDGGSCAPSLNRG
jgi:formate dehydrogenase